MKQGTVPPIAQDELGRIRAEAMEFAHIGLYRYRFDGTIVFFDRGAMRLLDLDERFSNPEELVGKKVSSLIEYVDPPGRLREAVRTHRTLRNFEYRYRTLTGKLRWVYHNSYIVTDPDTGEEQVQVIAQDITPLKEATRALQASERRYRVLAEQSLQGIGVIDSARQRLVFVNPALARLLGETREAVLGMSADEIVQRTDEQDRPAMRAMIAAGFEGRITDEPCDLRIVHAGDEIRWVTPSCAPIEIDGEPAVQITFVDSTERRLAEERRQALESRMQHTQKLESLGVLAGGIAHDFNNLLAGVLGNADLAARRMGDEEAVRGHLQEIRKASRRAGELCRQLLAYSGRYRLTHQLIELDRLVRDTAELLKLSISKKAALEIRLEPGLPPASGDPSQLRQVLMNLIINASEAVGDQPGTIELRTSRQTFGRDQLEHAVCGRESPAGPYLVIDVRDDGIGMDEATCQRIFEPFFTTKFTGRGLGLAAVLGIIRGHGGALFVESEPHRGSRFRVLLPPASERGDATSAEPAGEELWRGSGTALVVDDEEAIRATARAMLEELGFDVIVAEDGRAGIQAARARRKDVSLVLLDVLMPESDGRECYRTIRRLLPDVPVVFSSGYGEDAVSDLVSAGDRVWFLQKPYSLRDLSELLKQVF